jgi:AraC-like DNA-binding protein
MLSVSAAISDGALWRPIHLEPNVTVFELEHGVELGRDRYNARCLADARRTRKAVLGTHAGFSDWFVPVIVRGKVEAFLVTGPFAAARPSSHEILARWRQLSGQEGHPADPEFASYVSTTLGTLVLRGPQVADFGRLLERLSRLMAGAGDARSLLEQIDVLWPRIEEARLVERIWSTAHEMVDDRTARRWARPHEARGRALFGLPRMPDAALVGLLVHRKAELETVDDMLRRDVFQRQCVAIARKSGLAISGRVGDHGVTFLAAAGAVAQRRRQRLLDLGERAAEIARRCGFRFHFGVSTLPASAPLPRHYQIALEAAESAISQGVRTIATVMPARPRHVPLAEMRRELGRVVEQRPAELPARFDRYMEAVARHCAYRPEPARAYLEAALERITDGLRDSGVLEQKSFIDLLRDLDRSSTDARTIHELFAVFRRSVADISEAAQRPRLARRDRSLRRAIVFMREHCGEALTLRAVARVAGFAPNYFSALFKRRERTTFQRYLGQLRIERAKELLTTTELDIQRVATLSGLGTRQYLARAFQRNVGTTPSAYRGAAGTVRAG